MTRDDRILSKGDNVPLKPDGKDWTIKEQIVEDKVTGLSLQFEVLDNGEIKLTIYGESLPFGNRDLYFKDGEPSGSGTAVAGLCKPAWLVNTDEL